MFSILRETRGYIFFLVCHIGNYYYISIFLRLLMRSKVRSKVTTNLPQHFTTNKKSNDNVLVAVMCYEELLFIYFQSSSFTYGNKIKPEVSTDLSEHITMNKRSNNNNLVAIVL